VEHWQDSVRQRLPADYADLACRLIAAFARQESTLSCVGTWTTRFGVVLSVTMGSNGIVLGQGDPQGEAFLEIQRTALALRERGIVLAVSSKNN